jgi:hypothetical protein
MNAPEQALEAPGPRFPHDLRLWVDEDRLLRRVLDAASNLEAVGSGREFRHGSEQFSFGQMLATVSFAYLTGRYESDEVAEALEANPALRYLSAGRFPDPAAIRRFRRWHRGPLGVVLLRVLRACLAERRRQLGLAAPGRDAPPGTATCMDDLESLSRYAAEAEARLARAVFADTVALDV